MDYDKDITTDREETTDQDKRKTVTDDMLDAALSDFQKGSDEDGAEDDTDHESDSASEDGEEGGEDAGETDGEEDGGEEEEKPEAESDEFDNPMKKDFDRQINDIKSGLGRFKSDVSRELAELKALLLGKAEQEQSQPDDDDDDDEYVDGMTKREFNKMVADRVAKEVSKTKASEAAAKGAYEKAYFESLVDNMNQRGMTEAEAAEIVEEMKASGFTTGHGLGAAGDAEKNLLLAENSLLRKKAKSGGKKEVPGRGEGRKAPHGGKPKSDNAQATKKASGVKLDKFALEYAQENGLDLDVVREKFVTD